MSDTENISVNSISPVDNEEGGSLTEEQIRHVFLIIGM